MIRIPDIQTVPASDPRPSTPRSSDRDALRAAAASSPPDAAPATLASKTLLGGAREVLIRHGADVYRLRHTRNDKLILTK